MGNVLIKLIANGKKASQYNTESNEIELHRTSDANRNKTKTGNAFEMANLTNQTKNLNQWPPVKCHYSIDSRFE